MSEPDDALPQKHPLTPNAPAPVADLVKAQEQARTLEAEGHLDIERAEVACAPKAGRVAEEVRIREERRASRRAKWDRWKRGLYWKAFRLLPNVVPPPISRGDRDYAKQRDKESNESTRVPPGVDLRSPRIWGVELYGPSEIEQLYAGLKKLGWRRAGAQPSELDAVARIREQRSGGGGGWINIGSILPTGSKKTFSLTDNHAPLPAGVDALTVKVFFVTPSLTALCVGFHLSAPHVDRYERESQKELRTVHRVIHRPTAIQYLEPYHQKEDAIRAVRRELRAMVGGWFAKHVPGYFSHAVPRSEFPTMELLVAGAPLWLDGTPNRDDWRGLLTWAMDYDVWTYKDDPGLRLTFERPHDSEEGLHILGAVDVSAFSDEKLKHFGGPALSAYGWYCEEVVDGILLHSTTIEYLRKQRYELNLTRDRMKRARSGFWSFSRTLEEIGDFFDRTLGSSVVARELKKLAEQPGQYRHDCEGFSAPTWDAKGSLELREQLRKQVDFLSSQFVVEESALREHFEQLSTILSVRASRSATHRMEWLTGIAILIALASLFVALPGFGQEFEALKAFLMALGS